MSMPSTINVDLLARWSLFTSLAIYHQILNNSKLYIARIFMIYFWSPLPEHEAWNTWQHLAHHHRGRLLHKREYISCIYIQTAPLVLSHQGVNYQILPIAPVYPFLWSSKTSNSLLYCYSTVDKTVIIIVSIITITASVSKALEKKKKSPKLQEGEILDHKD